MNQLIDYARAAIHKSRKSEDRRKSKRSHEGYAVEKVPTIAPLQHTTAIRPTIAEGIEDPDENCSDAMRESVLLDGQQYRLVSQVVKGEIPGFLVRTSFDDVINEEGIDFEKLEARIKRLKLSGKLSVKTNAERPAPASTGRSEKVRTQEMGFEKGSSTNPKAMVFTITGCVTKLARTVAELEWFGGETLLVSRKHMFGNWENLSSGDWFKAVILRLPNGEVTQAILQSKILPPRYLNNAEIEDVYSKIKPAELTPMD